MKILAGLLLLLATTTAAAYGATRGFDAGVARVDITPKKSIWLSGYGNRNKASTGVLHPIWAKALAIRDEKKKVFVIVSTDLIGLPAAITDMVAARVQKEYNIDRAHLLFNSSHTHTGPYVRSNLTTMFSFTPEVQTTVDGYARDLADHLYNAIGSSLARMEAADVSYGTGSVGFAVNRRVPTDTGYKIGVNPRGPVDHSLPVLKVVSKRSGKTLAVVAGYACHNTTLTGEFYELSGDYAGFAQIEMENANPGAVAMFLLLCGADQNPNPRSSLELAKRHGKALADAAQQVLDTRGELKTLDGPISAAFEMTKLNFAPHTRETFEKEAATSKIPAAVRRAEFMLKGYDDGHPVRTLNYPVQAVSFGKGLTLLALGGEVVIDYAIRAKREFANNNKTNLVVLGYSNDVPCYIPSQRVLREGGYEANDSMIYYGQPGPLADDVEESIFAAARRVMKRVSAAK